MESLLVFYNVIVWLFCWTIANQCVNNCCKNEKYVVKNNTINTFFLLTILFSLFIFFGGDDARYREFAESGYEDILFYRDIGASTGKEVFYALVARFCGGNYLLWKIMVYVPCVCVTYLTIRRLKLNMSCAMLWITCLMLSSWGSTRAVLGYSVFLYGITLFLDRNLLSYVIGICFIVASYFLHSSLVLLIFLSPLLIFKLTKKRILILISLLPVLIVVGRIFLDNIFGNDMLMTSYAGAKLQGYTSEDKDEHGRHSILSIAVMTLNYITIFLLLYFSIKKDCKSQLSKPASLSTRLCFYIAYSAVIILFQPMEGTNFLFERFFTMIPFYIWVVPSSISPIENKGSIILRVSAKLSLIANMIMFMSSLYFDLVHNEANII